ncbi:MAG: hypothetical protein SFW64_08925 [Alphaproteobacteria bacterium]|nr:hypothetical protein [Alphaproteobacteria bacterium]
MTEDTVGKSEGSVVTSLLPRIVLNTEKQLSLITTAVSHLSQNLNINNGCYSFRFFNSVLVGRKIEPAMVEPFFTNLYRSKLGSEVPPLQFVTNERGDIEIKIPAPAENPDDIVGRFKNVLEARMKSLRLVRDNEGSSSSSPASVIGDVLRSNRFSLPQNPEAATPASQPNAGESRTDERKRDILHDALFRNNEAGRWETGMVPTMSGADESQKKVPGRFLVLNKNDLDLEDDRAFTKTLLNVMQAIEDTINQPSRRISHINGSFRVPTPLWEFHGNDGSVRLSLTNEDFEKVKLALQISSRANSRGPSR